jgi:hypothetical protein
VFPSELEPAIGPRPCTNKSIKTSDPVVVRSVLILSYLCIGFRSGLFPSGFFIECVRSCVGSVRANELATVFHISVF